MHCFTLIEQSQYTVHHLALNCTVHTDTLPRLQKALEEAEMIYQQLSVKQFQVILLYSNSAVAIGYQQSCIIQKKQNHDNCVVDDNAIAAGSSDHVMYVAIVMETTVNMTCIISNVEFHPIIYRQHEKMLFTTYQSFNKV